MNSTAPHNSSINNLEARYVAMLAYVASAVISFIPVIGCVAFLAPFFIYKIEKNSDFVKFHAMQAFILGLIPGVVGIVVLIISVFSVVPLINIIAALIIGILAIVLRILNIIVTLASIYTIYNAYYYKTFKMPVIGDIAASQAKVSGF